jgi:hypothetical protein
MYDSTMFCDELMWFKNYFESYLFKVLKVIYAPSCLD